MSSLNGNAGTDFGRRHVRSHSSQPPRAASLWGPPGPRVGQMPPARRPGLGPRGASRTAAECLLCPRQASPGAHLRPLLLPLRVPGPPCLTTSGGVAPAVCHASHGAKRTQQEAAPFLPPALPGWSNGRSVTGPARRVSTAVLSSPCPRFAECGRGKGCGEGYGVRPWS